MIGYNDDTYCINNGVKMRSLSIVACSLGLALLWQGTAYADDASSSPVFDSSYISIFGGGVFHHDIEHGYTHVNPAENGNSTHDMDAGYIFGAAIGAYVRPNIRAELELSHSSNDVNGLSFDNPIFSAASGPASGRVKSTNLMVNAWYEFGGIEHIRPYVGGGIGASFIDGKSRMKMGSIHEFSGTKTAFAFQAGLGSRIALTERVDLDLGYRFRGTPNVRLKSEIAGQVNKSAGLYSHTVQAGLIFKLNGN